jgi:hypothetical protein
MVDTNTSVATAAHKHQSGYFILRPQYLAKASHTDCRYSKTTTCTFFLKQWNSNLTLR